MAQIQLKMKGHLPNSLRALFLSLAVLISLPMMAKSVRINGIYYDLVAESKEAAVKSGDKYSGKVVIPESVEHEGTTYSVTSIGDWAFSHCSGLTSVTIPKSVTSIGDGAFCECSGLTSVTIPNSVTSIGSSAFSDCINLTSVVLPNNLTRIESSTFYNCSSLNTITIPNTVRSIGVGAIYGCKSLNSITIPPSVTLIEEYAFQECTGLSSVHISDLTAWCNITFEKMLSNPLYLAGHLFLNGKEIKDLIIPSGVTKIGYAGFCGGAGFTSVSIPNSVTSIGEWAFSYCSGLTSVTIGNSVTSIGSCAFDHCYSLSKVLNFSKLYISKGSSDYGYVGNYAYVVANNAELIDNYVFAPNGNTYALYGYVGTDTNLQLPEKYKGENYVIGDYAFSGCSGLTSVTIPNSVTSIGGGAFRECSGLTSVTIPNSVTSIGWDAFIYCSGLTSVTIGNSVTSIGGSAFYECSGLTSVTIPNSVTSIGSGAFYECSGLTSVTIPNSVTSIGGSAFYGCSGLTSVTIGSGVEEIYSSAFANCPELLDVYCYAENVPSTSSNAFNSSNYKNATLHVHDGSIENYKSTKPWSSFGNIVALTEEETGIEEVKTENAHVKTAVYDLSGRRVQKAEKGIYIQNGKLMVK